MTDERRDDEIIGRALSRAIETIDVNQTPFERSRIATTPARRSIFGFWQIATAAAAIVLALAIGSWLTRPTEDQLAGVAASPSASASATATPAATATASPTPLPTIATGLPDHFRVYFARIHDGRPPLGAHVDNAGVGATPAERIASRLAALEKAPAPNGSENVFPRNSGIGLATGSSRVTVSGDLATVDYVVPGGNWKVPGSSQSLALVQQLVYTATEEPGIRRLVVTVNGGQRATFDQIVWDKPLSREDVFLYSFVAGLGMNNGISYGGDDSAAHVGARLAGYDTTPAGAVVLLEGRGPNGQKADLPSFNAWLEKSDDTTPIGAKYTIYVELQWSGGGSSNGAADAIIIDQTPLRAITTNGNNVFRIELDDARPWRVSYIDNSRIAVEIGGDPRATSERIAVSAPKAGDRVTGQIRVTGSARVFEANVVWRLRDASGTAVANGHFLTNLGTSAVWGQFDQRLAIPATVHGNVTLELYEASAKDGSEQGLVAVPLSVP
jgi:hypothetical protein